MFFNRITRIPCEIPFSTVPRILLFDITTTSRAIQQNHPLGSPCPPPAHFYLRKVAETVAKCVILYTSVHYDLSHCKVSVVVPLVEVLVAVQEYWDVSFQVGGYRLSSCASL